MSAELIYIQDIDNGSYFILIDYSNNKYHIIPEGGGMNEYSEVDRFIEINLPELIRDGMDIVNR